MFNLDALFKTALALFVIMDPFASLPIFTILTRRYNDAKKLQAAVSATTIAAVTLVVFVLIGPSLMDMIGISMPAFTITGGILLLLTAIITFLGIETGDKLTHKDVDVKIVVVAVPLITGPGTMTTAVILAGQYGLLTTLIAIVIVIAAIFIVLSLSKQISKFAGKKGIAVMSKLFSILLAAIAIEFLKNGIAEVITEWGLI